MNNITDVQPLTSLVNLNKLWIAGNSLTNAHLLSSLTGLTYIDIPIPDPPDTTAPSVSISVPSGVQNGAFNATITFTEAVSNFLQSEVSLSGSAASVTSWSANSDNTVYTATMTPTASGTLTVGVAANVATDAANNPNTAATSKNVTVSVDTTAPGVTVSVPSGTQNGAFNITITFTEAVSGFVGSDVSLSGSAASITSWSTNSDNTVYTATVTPTASGTVTVSVAAEVAADAANNQNTAATSQSVEVDVEAPTVTIEVPSDTQTGAFEVIITFSESVPDFVQADLTLTGDASASVTAWSANTEDTIYTATITPTTSGEVTLGVAAGVATDGANNKNSAATQQTVNVEDIADVVPPGVSISVPSGVQNGGFYAPITFTEPVSGFGGTDVTVSGTATVRVSHVGTIDYIKYSVRIIPETSGTVVLNIAQGVATDAANNANTAATEQTVTVNLDLLTVKISDSNSRTRSGKFTVHSVFSHRVSDFGSTDVALSGTATASVASVKNIARYEQFHIAIQPTANGTLTVSIPTGGATNAAGNTNIASNSIDFTIELAADDSPEMTPSTIAWMPDGSLVDEVVSALGLADASTLTQAKMGELTTFSANGAGILSLTGLEHATNLTSLNLESNHITDIRPIKGLANLTYLNLSHNELGEVTLSNGLWIHHRHWPNLRELDLSHNNISCDTASLFSDHDGGSPRTYADPLPSLTRLDVSYNTGLDDAALFWGMGWTSPGIHRLNLTHLDIRYTTIDNVRTILYDYTVSHVGSANRIEWLRVEGTTFYELYRLRQIRKTLGPVIGPEIEYLIDVIDIDVEVPYSAYSSIVPLSPRTRRRKVHNRWQSQSGHS